MNINKDLVFKYLKGLLFFLVPFIVLTLLITILYYFDILNNQIIKYFKIIIIILSCLLGGFIIGRNSTSKGYLNGIKLSGIIVIIFLILNLIFKGFKWYHLVYYFIIIVTTTIGSMIGISLKKQ